MEDEIDRALNCRAAAAELPSGEAHEVTLGSFGS